MTESKEELKSLLRKVKEESEKAGLKLNIQKAKFMASSPIISWQTDGEATAAVQPSLCISRKKEDRYDLVGKDSEWTASTGKFYFRTEHS